MAARKELGLGHQTNWLQTPVHKFTHIYSTTIYSLECARHYARCQLGGYRATGRGSTALKDWYLSLVTFCLLSLLLPPFERAIPTYVSGLHINSLPRETLTWS